MSQPSRPRRVRPFPLAELPRLLRVQVELGRILWQHILAVLDAASSPVGGLHDLTERLGGPPRVRTVEPHLLPSDRLPSQLSGGYLLRLGYGLPGRDALLVVEERLCTGLGLTSPEELARLLRTALLAAEVRVSVSASEDAIALLDGGTSPQVVALDASVAAPRCQGWVRLLCRPDIRLWAMPTLSAEAEQARWQRRDRLRDIPVPLTIEAGYGFLSTAEVVALRPDDIVILDHFGPRPVTGGPVALRLRGGVFPAYLDGAGVTILGPFHLRAESMADAKPDNPSAEHPITSSEPTTLPSAPSEHLLRELPVQITCEIGRVTLTAREILELRPGAVVPVGRPLAGPVDLTAGGRVMARGELVDVEGELGVRVTEIIE